MLPYAGDAIAKPLKAIKVTEKISTLKKRIVDNAVKARQIAANALKKDAANIRVGRANKKGDEISKKLTPLYPMEVNTFGTHTPKKGWGKMANAVMVIGIQKNPGLARIR